MLGKLPCPLSSRSLVSCEVVEALIHGRWAVPFSEDKLYRIRRYRPDEISITIGGKKIEGITSAEFVEDPTHE